MNIQLPTGKTIYVSVTEYLFMSDSEIECFYRNMVADDAGDFLENPFKMLKCPKEQVFELPDISEISPISDDNFSV